VILPLLFPLVIPLAGVFSSPRAQGDWGVAYAPAAQSRRVATGAIVFLHGMWASPEDSCGAFESAATPFGFLVCPRANAPFPEGGPGYTMWSGSWLDAARPIHAALEAADALAPGQRAKDGGTLIGFSNGAYFAAEVACAEPGRWPGIILLSMKLDLEAARLKRAGVARVLLAAGDRDEARSSMEALAARLAAGGVESRYMSLGDVGHAFPPDMGARMCAAIAWVRHVPDAPCMPARR
jgi:predicted esterase